MLRFYDDRTTPQQYPLERLHELHGCGLIAGTAKVDKMVRVKARTPSNIKEHEQKERRSARREQRGSGSLQSYSEACT